jgi:hypothetical protein
MDEAEAHAKLALLVGGPGFTGNSPAGRSRWSGRERQVVPVQPKYVVEVSADHIEDNRFRHGRRYPARVPACCPAICPCNRRGPSQIPPQPEMHRAPP